MAVQIALGLHLTLDGIDEIAIKERRKLALIAEILSMVPQIASAGISIADLVSKTRAVLDENAAPGDAQWDALDAQVKDLQAQLAVDPPITG